MLMLALLVMISSIAAFVTWNALLIQSGMQAFIHGESLWSRGQQRALFYADRYADTGNPADIQLARETLSVSLAGYNARLALEQTPTNSPGARRELLAAGNSTDSADLIIWLHRYFSRVPYITDAMHIWRKRDQNLLDLRTLIDQLASAREAAGAGSDTLATLRVELTRIEQALSLLTRDFTLAIMAAEKKLRLFLLATCVLTLVILLLLGGLLILRLRRARSFFDIAFRQAAIGMAEVSADGYFIDVNQALCTLLRYSRAQLIGSRFQYYTHPEDLDYSTVAVQDLASGAKPSQTFDKRYIRSDGEVVWARITESVIQAHSAAPPRLFIMIEDITHARKLSDELSHQASHDSLTGLLNRREFEQILQLAVENAQSADTHHMLAFIDLDQFKVVNDTCGHISGDHMLCQVALVLRNSLREPDVLARLGGDEFAVLFHDTSVAGARVAVEKLHQAVHNYSFHWQGRTFGLSSSIGLASINRSTPNSTWVLQAADTACNMAKNSGRARIQLFVDKDEATIKRRREMEWASEIRAALDNDRLSLYAQLILATDSRPGYRYEILIRLTDTRGIQHPPGAFLPAAERSNMIGELDQFVLTRSLQMLTAQPNHLEHLEACHINVSGHSIAATHFCEQVKDTLIQSGIDCSKICFQITETAAVTHLHDALSFIEAVRGLGCQVSLGDFGSSLSSFGYLKTLPVDLLKIDDTFTHDIQDNAQNRSIIQSIIGVARALNKTTIAEFIEHPDTIPVLHDLGVSYIQGFAVHRPEPFESLLKRLDAPPYLETPARIIVPTKPVASQLSENAD